MIVFEDKIMLKRVISGGQTGADQAGLYSAKQYGYETGGFAPQGFRTLAGDNPVILRDIFHLEETSQRNYQFRTALNVKSADATVRLATNFQSPGELCTMNAIRKYAKPFFDVDLLKVSAKDDANREAYISSRVDEFIDFLIKNQVVILNVAGNADRTPTYGFGLHFNESVKFLNLVFKKINDQK